MADWLTARETAARLGISSATVYNWERAGLLPARPAGSPHCYCVGAVESLAADLAAGRVGRLRRGANKRSSERRGGPAEYPAGGRIPAGQVRELRRLLRPREDGALRPLLAIALRLLVERGEVPPPPPGAPLTLISFHGWRRQSVRRVITGWFRAAGGRSLPERYREIFRAAGPFPPDGDPLGTWLQLLRPEGAKSRSGSYFTPPETARELIAGMPEEGTLLDPACGSGQFLLAAAAAGRPFDRLLGIEIDPAAAFAARLNLLLAFPEIDRPPLIRTRDALTPHPFRGDHLVANPPWGRMTEAAGAGNGRSRELAGCFLAAAERLAAPGGTAAMLIPESLLTVHRHRQLREFMAGHFTMKEIRSIGRRFPGVFTNVILLRFENRPPRKDDRTLWIDPQGRERRFDPARLSGESWLAAGEEPPTAAILEKIHHFPHLTLAGRAEWALGIVTGDNRRLLKTPGTPGCEPVYRGCDILPGRLAPPRNALRFRPEEFQQTAPERFYRAPEKLIYRFIGRKLVFACDRTGALTLNSANLLLIPPDVYPMKTAGAIFSSTLYNFLFQKKFHALKILRRDLEQLPLPLLPPRESAACAALADRISAGDEKAATELDRRLYALFRLTPEEIAFTERSVKSRNQR